MAGVHDLVVAPGFRTLPVATSVRESGGLLNASFSGHVSERTYEDFCMSLSKAMSLREPG